MFKETEFFGVNYFFFVAGVVEAAVDFFASAGRRMLVLYHAKWEG